VQRSLREQFKESAFFVIKDLMECMFTAFSVIHSSAAALPNLSVL